MNNRSLHIYPSAFEHESRIQKETKSLVDGGIFDKIFIIALWENGLEEHEHLDDKREVWRVRLKTAVLPESTFWKIIKHIEWMLKIYLRFRKSPIKFVNCHNLSALPIGMLFKRFLRSKVVYDTHELETERNGWSGIRRAIAKILERSLIHKVDIVLVVSESIAQWYRDNYSLTNVHCIYNYPHKQIRDGEYHSNVLKETFGIQNDEILFIYQGLLDSGRSVEILLNVFSKIDKKKHVVFMGYGPLEDVVTEYSEKFSNIHFQPAVEPDDVISYTQSADVGLSLIENTSLSYYLTLANKVVEYIAGGVPVITTDFPEPARIIDSYKCGWKVLDNKQSITDLIESISKEDIKEKKNNAISCKDNFHWKKEEEKLLKIYQNSNDCKIESFELEKG